MDIETNVPNEVSENPAGDYPAKAEQRLVSFAAFFKNYMAVSAIVVAALPIPVTATNVLPVPDDLRGPLSVYTSMLCFLVLAFVFYSRGFIARATLNRGRANAIIWALPFLLILLTIICILRYHAALWKLESTSESMISVIGAYLGIFVSAEAAFVLMALREYVHDRLGISERDVLLDSVRRQGPRPDPRNLHDTPAAHD